MIQVFIIKDGSPGDGRGRVETNLMPTLVHTPLHIKVDRTTEVFFLPEDYNAAGYFMELYEKRYGTDIGLTRFLAELGL